ESEAEHRRNIQVRNTKVVTQQMWPGLQLIIEYLERGLEALGSILNCLFITLIGRQEKPVAQNRHQVRLDFGHPEKAPLVTVSMAVGRRRPKRWLAVLFGEIQIDRHRFP